MLTLSELKYQNYLYHNTTTTDVKDTDRPILTDEEYDAQYAILKSKFPTHPFFSSVGSEVVKRSSRVAIPIPMLSTDKAYNQKALRTWFNTAGVGALDTKVKLTPKLDGFAAYRDGWFMCTRGDGENGMDISHVLERGLSGGDGAGPGEIVIASEYFELNLKDSYTTCRSVISSVIKISEPDELIRQALIDGAVRFKQFDQIPSKILLIGDVIENIEQHMEDLAASVPYDTDGVVIEFMDQSIKDDLGSGETSHKWQIAYKINTQFGTAKINNIESTVGRTGKITPIVHIDPTVINNVTILKLSGHNWTNLTERKIAPGATIEIVRAGDVIPTISSVVEESPDSETVAPSVCPCCDHKLESIGKELFCTNVECPDRQIASLQFFFANISIDHFGPATCKILVDNGFVTPLSVIEINDSELASCGFGTRQIEVLLEQITILRGSHVPAWKVIHSFGIQSLGKANSKKLMADVDYVDVGLTSISLLNRFPGWGAKTVEVIFRGLAAKITQIEAMSTVLSIVDEVKVVLKEDFADCSFVFTGTFDSGSRAKISLKAQEMGLMVQSLITKKTTHLVTGESCGQSKLNKAKKYGIKIITEKEYFDLIS